jgi:hypothetical protein
VVALARSIFHKGANFTAAMVLELASTNLMAEVAIIMVILLGWQFAAAEFIGAPVMVAILAALFRLFLELAMVERARRARNARQDGRSCRDGHGRHGRADPPEDSVGDVGKNTISH